jgi:tetratricopeptide (TPR) repeat protein
LVALGRYAEAEEVLSARLQALQRQGEDTEQLALVLNELGVVHRYQARHREAEKMFRHSLLVYRRLGMEHGLAGL